MAISSWLCTSSTKNMLLKIVHPGGHVELHDRPILAAELMLRNPRCCVAHPHVFQQPWAIVEPETTLMPGKKFYVVPIGTIRKLQRNALKYSPSSVHQIRSAQSSKGEGEDTGTGSAPKLTYASMKPNIDKQGCFSDDNCFMCLLRGIKIQENGDDSSQETRSSSTISSSSEVKVLTRKRTRDFTRHRMRGSPKKLASLDHWQPSLESIKEE